MYLILLCSKHFIQRCVQDLSDLVPINAPDSRLLFQGHIWPLPNNYINKQTNKQNLFIFSNDMLSSAYNLVKKWERTLILLISIWDQSGYRRKHPGTKIVMWQILNRWKKAEKKMKQTRCFVIYWPNVDKKAPAGPSPTVLGEESKVDTFLNVSQEIYHHIWIAFKLFSLTPRFLFVTVSQLTLDASNGSNKNNTFSKT